MRFLVDMPLSPVLALWLMEQGHDAVHASHVGLARSTDAAILQHARDQQRIVVTADLDYPRILALTQVDSPGLILFRGGNYSEQESISRPRDALNAIPSTELHNSVVVIEKSRIRRRRLPV